MRTPLGKVRGLGSAKDGTEHFWRQRLTALANIPLIIFFVVLLVCMSGRPYADVVGALASPFVAIPLLAVVISALIHMRLGMQAIVEDYVQGELAKALTLAASTFFCAAVGIVSIFSILKLAFGG
jgi:succinate dehydrogenase / fumarate reductase membrane anchor subunit